MSAVDTNTSLGQSVEDVKLETAHDVEKAAPGQTSSDKWTAALERLSHEDRDRFSLATTTQQSAHNVLADVLEATTRKKNECMEKRWKVVIKGRTIILRDLLEKISVWVTKLVQIGDTVIQYDPGHAALPWAAIRVILQATVNDVEVFGWVLQSVENIANLLATCRIFELRYLQQNVSGLDAFEQLSGAAVVLYARVLTYLAAVLHHYSQGLAARFVKSVASPVATFEAKYAPIRTAQSEAWALAQLAEAEKSERIQASLDRIEGDQESAAVTLFETLGAALKEMQEPISRASIQLAEIQDGLERETRARILKAISLIPYSIHHKNARKGRLEGSGQWLLQKPEYKSWRASSASSVLWLHGIPGSGKTKLTSLVIDELAGCDNLAYFYCMRNPAEPQRGKGDQVLASLVRQLAGSTSDKPILAPVVTQYEEAIDGLCEFEDQAWTAAESARVLLELMEGYPAATIVLDALDEVNQEDRQELLDVLSELLQDSPSLLKIFISSRDNYDIALHFDGSPNVYIEADDNAPDISSFIDDRLKSARLLHNRLAKDLEAKIVDTLLRGARGMFRWVDLQIQSLRPLKVAADIEARLGALPATLEGSYWEIYQAIQESGDHAAALADFTFQWLMYARGTVTAEVFACIASSTLQSGAAARFAATEVIDVCYNLVVSRNGSLEFAHLSVREFFEGLHKRNVDRLLLDNSNGCIATACLQHLRTHIESAGADLIRAKETTTDPEDWPPYAPWPDGEADIEIAIWTGTRTHPTENSRTPYNNNEEIVIPADETEAVFYAARFWIHHVCESGEMRQRDPLATAIKEFLGAKSPIANGSFQVSRAFQLWCQVVQSMISSALLTRWNETRLDQLEDSSAQPPNPFWLACLHDWYDIVDFLLAAEYEGIDQPRRLSSISYAKISALSDHEVPPLWYAILERKLPLVDRIWRHSPGLPLLYPKYQSELKPLAGAARKGDEEFVIMLLGMEHGGLDTEVEAFSRAAEYNRCKIMEILLAHNDRILGEVGQDALRGACIAGQSDAVAFLLDRGVPTRLGGLFLCRSVFNGCYDVVRVLLERRVGLDCLSKALIIAMSNDDKITADILLGHGAQKEPPAVTREVKIGSRTTAIRLIERGYDISGRYLEKRRTPLHYAAERGYDDVVGALLSAGAPLDIHDEDGKTPLHLAAHGGHASCAELLLSRGADVLAEDAEGRIPLDLAEDRKHDSTETAILVRMVELRDELQRAKALQMASER